MNSVELKGVFTRDEDPSRLVMHTPSHTAHAGPADTDLLFMTKRWQIPPLTPLSFVRSRQIIKKIMLKLDIATLTDVKACYPSTKALEI